tara:strand:- start:24147 stop:24392 length:246 start_codon:yes stop_codon:yes gene_type:complete
MDQIVKTVIANRVPPGDRWNLVGDSSDNIQATLMDALEAYYLKTNYTGDFYFSPREGKIFKVGFEEAPAPPPKRYSIYEND